MSRPGPPAEPSLVHHTRMPPQGRRTLDQVERVRQPNPNLVHDARMPPRGRRTRVRTKSVGSATGPGIVDDAGRRRAACRTRIEAQSENCGPPGISSPQSQREDARERGLDNISPGRIALWTTGPPVDNRWLFRPSRTPPRAHCVHDQPCTDRRRDSRCDALARPCHLDLFPGGIHCRPGDHGVSRPRSRPAAGALPCTHSRGAGMNGAERINNTACIAHAGAERQRGGGMSAAQRSESTTQRASHMPEPSASEVEA
ncbi:hypothetical protein ABIA39_006891 [Nocardia sp. GAS34]